MEEPTTLNQANLEPNNNLCVSCRLVKAEEGHNTRLCSDCRKRFINYPIPKWIKLFALGILAVVIIGLVRTQKYVSIAYHLSRGEKAIEQLKFVTAQRELAQVLKNFPDDFTANADMIIAASYNLDFTAVDSSFHKIADVRSEDQDLLAKVDSATSYLAENNSKDTIMAKKISAAMDNRDQLLALNKQTDTAIINDPALKAIIADHLFDLNDYASVEKILDTVLIAHPNFSGGLRLMSAEKRNTGKYDEAMQYCDRMLAINKEDIYAIAQKAKIELKRHHDTQAAGYANKAMQIDPNDDSALEAMAMVNYYEGRQSACKSNLSAIKSHIGTTGDSIIFKRLSALLNGSETYR